MVGNSIMLFNITTEHLILQEIPDSDQSISGNSFEEGSPFIQLRLWLIACFFVNLAEEEDSDDVCLETAVSLDHSAKNQVRYACF